MTLSANALTWDVLAVDGAINANSVSSNPSVAIMSSISVLQNTALPAPIIAILRIAVFILS